MSETRQERLEKRRAYYAANRESLREYARKWAAANPETGRKWAAANPDKVRAKGRRSYHLHRESRVERSRDWRERNPEKRRETCAAWRARNPEKRGEAVAGWRARNPEHHKIICRVTSNRRRARKRQAEGHFSPDDIARITKAQGGKCAHCRKRRKLEIDHIKALAKGGTNWPSNIQMLCKPCNGAKSARDPIEFAQSKGLLL